MANETKRKVIPYGRQSISQEDIKAVVNVLRSDWITQGPRIQEFEKALCRYTGAKYAVAVANGTAGLHLACLAAGVGPGDEVITSPMTFLASANCVLYCGGTPVFADIQPDTGNIDPEEIAKKISARTKAVIPVHFAGHPCDLKEIRRMARKHKLVVIEDACHALGAEYQGKKIGACQYSDMTVFSFHPVKSITTGEGGAVLTNNKRMYEKLVLLRNHGMTRDKAKIKKGQGDWYCEMQALGFNYRITDIQCALGIGQLSRLDRFLAKRRQLVQVYQKALADTSHIQRPVELPGGRSAWHIYPVFIHPSSLKPVVFKKLKAAGIRPQVHYMPVYWHPYYYSLGYRKGLCPGAEEFYRAEITVPLYPSLKLREVHYVVRTLKDILEEVR